MLYLLILLDLYCKVADWIISECSADERQTLSKTDVADNVQDLVEISASTSPHFYWQEYDLKHCHTDLTLFPP